MNDKRKAQIFNSDGRVKTSKTQVKQQVIVLCLRRSCGKAIGPNRQRKKFKDTYRSYGYVSRTWYISHAIKPYDMGPPALLPIGKKVCCGFLSLLIIYCFGRV
jgi:hypothetical protein